MQRLTCDARMRYYRVDGTFYHFRTIGYLPINPTKLKTKFQPELFEVADLPETPYAPAKLSLRDLEAGVAKYFNPIKHYEPLEIARDLKNEFNLTQDVDEILKLIERKFESKFQNLDLFLEKPLPFEVVMDLAVHDLQGSLRGNTSAGIGFHKDRKTLARTCREDFRSLYDADVLDFSIYWKMFLKDELRLKEKKTRSIAVGQLHLWFVTMQYLGGLYFWFKTIDPEWSAFGLDNTIESWTNKLANWDPERLTQGFDISKQDSRMSPAYASFLENFLKRHAPASSWEAIEWYFSEAFFYKKIVDGRGNVLMFSQGEASGDPLTILKNILHTLFLHCQHEVVVDCLDLIDDKKLLVLGDDVLMQSDYPDILKKVCTINGHDTTDEQGRLFDDVQFLSMKLHLTKNGIAPYYANLEKMWASLQYTTGDTNEYFQKICSFLDMLVFAPKGSLEKIWWHKLDKHARYLMTTGEICKDYLKCYKPRAMLRRNRLG